MKPKVMLDAGHGGKDSGAVGPTGLREKDIALSVVQLTASILIGAGIEVLFTRRDDAFVELPERARLANAAGVDAFVSIHCNSASTPARGFEVYTTPGQTRADALATEVFKSFGIEFPEAIRRMDSSDGDPDKEANFAVLRLTQAPAILFELEFVSSPDGERFLKDSANQARCAKAIAAGILAGLGMSLPAVLDVTDDGDDLRSRFERFLAATEAHSVELAGLAGKFARLVDSEGGKDR